MTTTNLFFNNQDSFPEKNMYNNLAIEFIKIHGIDVIYMPRSTPNIDRLFLEDPTSEFTEAIHIEMYIKTFEGWGGDQDTMSKFGVKMADTIVLAVMKERFLEELVNLNRPREGDLIYIPMVSGMFEIKFVEHEAIFYQLGNLNSYELSCERFDYSSESITTGFTDLDSVEDTYTLSTYGFRLITESGLLLTTETSNGLVVESFELDGQENEIAQNSLFNTEGENIDRVITNIFNR